jgi:uncharacterized protein (DUF58 family)
MRVPRSLKAVASRARSIVPLSARGLGISALAAVILAAGVLRADLAALFWGASFLLYAVYALTASHLFRLGLSRRSRSPGFLSLSLPAGGRSPGEESEAHIGVRVPRAFPPGFALRVTLPLAWQERRIDEVTARLSPGPNERLLKFTPRFRGTYTSREAQLEMRDILGFTMNRLPVAQRESLTVLPSLLPAEDLMRFMEPADQSTVYARSRRRNEELLEARKYYPGDDVRRLNWKVFAHLDELFLRIGEEVPPPEARILVVLDCTRNPLVPARLAADYLDRLVEAAAALMAGLAVRRAEVLLALPGLRECRPYDEESLPRLLSTLANVWWTDAPWAPELPSRRSLHVAVLSSPGSPGLGQIMRVVKDRGWGSSLLIKGLDPGSAPRRLRLKDLLFVPETAGKARAPLGSQERSALAEALSRDLTAYGGEDGQVRHAAQI